MTVLIKACDFNAAGFCEYQLFVESQCVLPTMKPKKTEYQLSGIKAHEKIDAAFLNQTRGTISLAKFLVSKRRMRTRLDGCTIVLAWENEGYKLVGRMDEIISDITGIYVCDDKKSRVAYIGMKNQVRAYCLLLKKNFEKELNESRKNIYALLRNYVTGQYFWKEMFGIQEERLILQELERIKQIKEGTIAPRKASGKKCEVCQYRDNCFKL